MKEDASDKWLGPIATTLSILACYGTLAAFALLGALGVTMALNEAVWAGVIVLFAGLAFLALLRRWRRHRGGVPVLLAGIGFVLIAFTMLGPYSRAVELAGFVFLCAGTYVDWRIGRRREEPVA